MGPRAGLDPLEESLAPAGNRTAAVQPVAIPSELSITGSRKGTPGNKPVTRDDIIITIINSVYYAY